MNLPKPWKKIWFSIFFIFALLYLARAWQVRGSDIRAYYLAGQALLSGESIYQNTQYPFKYLPFFAFIISPFTCLGFFQFKIFMGLLGLGSWLAVLRIFLAWTGPVISLVTVFIGLKFINHEMQYLQINTLNLLLIMLAYVYRRESMSRYWSISAFCLAVAASSKITPLMLLAVPFLLGQKKIWWGTLSLFVIFNLIAAAFTVEGPWQIINSWQNLIASTSPYPASSNGDIQSLNTALWAAMKSWGADPKLFLTCLTSLFILLLTVSLWPIWTSNRKHSTETLALWTYASLMVMMVLFSPTAWKYIYLLTLPVTALLLQKRKTTVVILVFLFTTLAPLILEGFWPKAQVRKFYLPVFGLLILWCGAMIEIYAERKRQISQIAPS